MLSNKCVLQCGVVITWSILSQIFTKDTHGSPLGRGMGCLLWILHLIDIMSQFLQLLTHNLTVLDRAITALDCNFKWNWSNKLNVQSILRILIAWCFSTRASIATVLTMHPCVFRCLIHWGWVTHICVGIITNIGSDNGLSPGRRQAIIWTNAGILLIEPLGTNFSEILIRIQAFSFKKMHLKMSSAKWRPFCLGLNVLSVKRSSRTCKPGSNIKEKVTWGNASTLTYNET